MEKYSILIPRTFLLTQPKFRIMAEYSRAPYPSTAKVKLILQTFSMFGSVADPVVFITDPDQANLQIIDTDPGPRHQERTTYQNM